MSQASFPRPPSGQADSANRARDPGEAFARAELLQQGGQLSEAELIYRRLLQTHPDHPAVLHNLGRLLRARGNFSEAESVLRRALAFEPREAALHNALGGVLRALGRTAEAEGAYRKACELWPDSAEAHHNLGALLEESGRAAEALAEYRRAAELNPTFGKTLTRIGAILQGQGSLTEALNHLNQAVASAPDHFDAHYYRGWVLSALGQHDAALSALQRAATLRPDSFEAALASAVALRDAGRADAALDAYWKVLEMQPARGETHEEINKLAWISGRKDLYLRSFAYAREKLGEQPDLLALEAAFHLRRDGFADAERLARSGLAIAPARADLAGLLARALAGQGRFDESYARFSDAIRAEPGAMRYWQEFGFALLRGGQAGEALKLFEHALTLSPFDQLILAGLAVAARQMGSNRYRELVDFNRYVRVYDLAAPESFPDAVAFNKVLAVELDRLHTSSAEPIDQTLRGGTQTTGRLFQQQTPIILELRERIAAAVKDYIGHLSSQPAHPAESRKGPAFEFSGSWSCRLQPGGYHHNHVHPQGWISSAYYARLPQVLDDSKARQGWLRFGESNLQLGNQDVPDFFVKPAVGRLVLFPSFYWHGTVPFTGSEDRLAISFDVVPAAVRPARG